MRKQQLSCWNQMVLLLSKWGSLEKSDGPFLENGGHNFINEIVQIYLFCHLDGIHLHCSFWEFLSCVLPQLVWQKPNSKFSCRTTLLLWDNNGDVKMQQQTLPGLDAGNFDAFFRRIFKGSKVKLFVSSTSLWRFFHKYAQFCSTDQALHPPHPAQNFLQNTIEHLCSHPLRLA